MAVFAIYFTLPFVALSALPVVEAKPGDLPVRNGTVEVGERYTLLGLEDADGGYAGNPILGVIKQIDLGPFQTAAEVYLAVLAALILFLATNAGLFGVSRLVYSMGIHRQFPNVLRQLHPRFRTPWIGLLIFGAISIITLIPGQATFLANMYAFGAMLSFTIAHLAVTTLRRTQPDVPRPYRGPGNLRIRGYDAPLFAIVGGTGTALAFVVVTALHPTVAIAGAGWMILGVLVYTAYRRNQGLDLVSTHKVAIEQPVTEHEAEYDSVLVHFGENDFDPSVIATAARLAARKRRGIHVLVTINVPNSLPIDAELPEQEAGAQSIIEQARIFGGRRVSGHYEKVRAGQQGRRIVEEAQDMRAAAVVLALPQRIQGQSLFGKTLETVLAERPCRVIIESSAAPVRRRRKRAMAWESA
jgi:APA family basic amino acid/polyamine antiporter